MLGLASLAPWGPMWNFSARLRPDLDSGPFSLGVNFTLSRSSQHIVVLLSGLPCNNFLKLLMFISPWWSICHMWEGGREGGMERGREGVTRQPWGGGGPMVVRTPALVWLNQVTQSGTRLIHNTYTCPLWNCLMFNPIILAGMGSNN